MTDALVLHHRPIDRPQSHEAVRATARPTPVRQAHESPSFFAYHGWLAPGVRLFRSISFPAKAAWISTIFTLPLCILMWFLWSASMEQVDFANSERRGLTYVEPLRDLIVQAEDLRRAATTNAPDLADAKTRVTDALAKVEAKQKELGAEFSTASGFEAMQKAVAAVSAAPVLATPDATYAAHTNAIDAMLTLMGNVADGSQLSLDPELETYHLMNMAVVAGPQYVEYMGRLRALGHITLTANEVTGAPQLRMNALVKAHSLMDYMDANYENSYKLSVESLPEFAKTLDMDGVDKTREAFLDALEKQVLGATPNGDAAAFVALGTTAIDKQRVMNKQISVRLEQRLKDRITRENTKTYAELGMSVFFVFTALYLMLAFYRVMLGGLNEVGSHLDEIAQGNLTTAPKPWGKDEAAQLMLKLGTMQTNLRRIARTALDSAASVEMSSKEIASASMDLSARTESNAASLEETASSMEEISSTVKHTADTVGNASSIVKSNAIAATRGGQVIEQVVSTMSGIKTSSSQIGEIIGVIDGIAFQTNILALNAAVEAARAGEQGRGFAVVASEVRALAGRSAAAAKEIKTLISTSISQVEAGNRVVADAGQTMQEIVQNAGKIDAMMNEIAMATREQSAGVAQVATAVQELDQGTQQNAALVEQTAASASNLADAAQQLSQEVSFFKLV